MKKILVFSIVVFAITTIYAAGITFTFSNVVITGSVPTYLEFDVMAEADVAGSRLGDNIVYINYNTLGFETSVAAAGKVSVEKGTLLLGDFGPPAPYYTIINIIDNTTSRFAVTCEYNYPDSPEYGNEVLVDPTQLMHIKMEIADTDQTSGLSFEQSLMENNEYESDNTAKYSPVIANDTNNSSLQPSAIEPNTEKPTKYLLKQNYPNPFNPTTKVEFEIPEYTDNLELSVFNVVGQKIATLYKGQMKIGRFSLIWDGTNSLGRLLPSGVYFVNMSTKNYKKSVKVILMK